MGDNLDPNPNPFSYANNNMLNLNLSTQNVRSFNISTKNDITIQKIIAITSLKSDIIFLSDLRLNSTKQISAVHDLEKQFFFKGYKIFHNSTGPSRGVGLLIKKNLLEKSLRIVDQVHTADCNLLQLNCIYNNNALSLVSIYGPNHDNEPEFYENLTANLRNINSPVIIAGDWNATLDTSDVGANLDVINMRSIPSLRRSEKILEICQTFSLLDPFRILNPEKKEYTFIPSSVNEQNRSRLDFFLISHQLITNSTKCVVPHGLLTTYFDHKYVQLFLAGKRSFKKGLIKDIILDTPDLTSYVKISVFECYLQHWTPGANLDGTVTDEQTVRTYLTSIGRIMVLLNNIKEREIRGVTVGNNNLEELLIAAERAEIQLIFEDLPGIDFYENLSTNMVPEFFLQTISNCIKNNVLSHQSHVYKLRNLNTNKLKKQIADLKLNFNQNVGEILEKERQLSDLVEGSLKVELQHFKKFETLNNERITPYFMSIVKSKNSADSLSNLKKDDGTNFNNKDELKQHIHGYYSDIYKQPENFSRQTSLADIENFLGPVANDPIVQNAKLSEQEKIELEGEITEAELTKSINDANMASAPGADGISNRFIKKFWIYFKKPMLKLCETSFENGTLPLFLRTANIKLIPKKGDVTKIKNWRPISLLNCFYKIISRAITARLRKFMDKMTPICQKGYSGSRYCQEVLISIMEGIEKCNVSKNRAGIISLDIKKAFDSLSHSYLDGVYQFYNFGPRLIRWIKILCTNRKACIILEDQLTTSLFDLERGNAQGDTISPFLFNLGYQILLFKLELCLQIQGILGDTATSVNNFLIQQGHQVQVSHSDPKAFALADDCSLLVRLEAGNLRSIVNVLTEYETISGLTCNLEKTALMVVGNNDQVPQEIIDIGFELQSEITLLGAKIKNTGICYEGNGTVIIEKIRRQTNFWKRFNLSLPGRINVAKTFLYSQINYLGCFLPIGDADKKQMSTLIENFVSGNLRIAKRRLYAKKGDGGLDLFELDDYLGAQCCSWVKRAYNLDEIWKKELFLKSRGKMFNLRQKDFDKRKNPILYNIAGYFEKFIYKFTVVKENFRKAFMYDNPCLKFDFNGQHFLKRTFFNEEEWQNNEYKIKSLTLDMILGRNDEIFSKEVFEIKSGMTFTLLKYHRIVALARTAIRLYKKHTVLDCKTDTVQNFLMRVKRGSRHIRNVLTGSENGVVSQNIFKYAELTETVINAEHSRILNLSWSFGYLTNSVKTFTFKLHNNLLGLNSRVAHFVRGQSSNCTFCDIMQTPEDNRETTLHLFYDCPCVEELLAQFFSWIFSTVEPRHVSRLEFFVGFDTGNEKKDKTLNVINLLVKKFIWDCKLRYCIPSLESLKTNVCSELKRIASVQNLMKDLFIGSELFNIQF